MAFPDASGGFEVGGDTDIISSTILKSVLEKARFIGEVREVTGRAALE